MRILLVDDEPGVVRALTRLFKGLGHEVASASCGPAAVALLDHFEPDAVVSDYRMPGMTGAELLAVVARRYPAARRVLLSGFADARGPFDATFVSKPYDRDQLVAACL